MLVLGVESSCDETGVALYDSAHGLLAHALYSQIAMHNDYGGVVPELASRDHIRRVLPLTRQVLAESGRTLADIDGIAYTQGPGLAGALLVGAGMARALAFALNIPAVGVHHLEGHMLSPLISDTPPEFPFVALLVSGGHTQLMLVSGVGRYTLLGETLDDAAGEAFDKTAQLLGLGYPGGPALSKLAATGDASRFTLPRPMLNSGDFDFSFSGLEDRGADAGAQGGAGRGGGYRSGIPGGSGGGAGEQEPGGLRAQRRHAAGGCRRRGRQHAPARTAHPRGGGTRHQRVLSAAGILHRQRRDDRLRRRAAAGARAAAADLTFAVKPRWELATLEAV